MSSLEPHKLHWHLEKCLQIIGDLEKNYANHDLFLAKFNSFLQTLFGFLIAVKVESSMPQNQLSKTKTCLCLSQVAKALTLFGTLFKQSTQRQSVWYLCERLRWCLSELCRLLTSPTDDQDPSGSFLLRIDLALDHLESSNQISDEFHELLDDLVCHAVTVAKVTGSVHYQEITATCQKLLNEHKELADSEQNNENEEKLLIASMSASLRSLEERVSSALLNIFLLVFSEPHWPLKQLVRACSTSAEPRSVTDLDSAVAQLDDHIERIVLIGQFAVSCCEDKKALAGIRCCLASLESVENYLVPAIKAFYLSPTSNNCRHFVKFLCDHWQDEVAALQLHLSDVIDSRALVCAVKESLEEFYDQLEHTKDDVLDRNLKKSIRSYGWLLFRHLARTSDSYMDFALSAFKELVLENEIAFKENKNIKRKKKHLYAVLDSLIQILEKKVVLMSETTQSSNEGSNSENGVQDKNVDYNDGMVSTKCSSALSTTNSFEDPTNIQDVPLDVSFQSDRGSQCASYRPQWLQKKLSTAKDVYQTKSIHSVQETRNSSITGKSALLTPKTPKTNGGSPKLSEAFKTPRNVVKPDIHAYLSRGKERNVTLYVRTPRREMQTKVMDETVTEDTSRAAIKDIDSLTLDISDILDNLSFLANTLTSLKEMDSTVQPNRTTLQRPLSPLDKKSSPSACSQSLASGLQSDSQSLSLASVRTDQISDVNTPERLQDLQDLDDRIQLLKML